MKTKLILLLSVCAIIGGCGAPVAQQAAAANNSTFVALGTLGARTVKCTAMQETQIYGNGAPYARFLLGD
jgi:hypothetical protein